MPKPHIANRTLPLMGLLIVIGLCCGCASGGGQSNQPAPLTPDQMQLNVDSFDMVWQTIHDKHWDLELVGPAWTAARDTLRPKVVAATTTAEVRVVMQSLIDQLGQSHFGIIPAAVYDDATGVTEKDQETKPVSAEDATEGSAGLDIRLVDNQVLVVTVDEASPAAAAGITPGWEIIRIDDKELAPLLERLDEALEGRHMVSLIRSRAVLARLKGDSGDTVLVDLIDGSGNEVSRALVLGEVRGTPVTMGNLPEVSVWSESALLDDNLGYFRFNYFLGIMEIMPAYNTAMAEYQDCAGIIVDLRGNPGGLGGMAMGMSGWFIQDKGHILGTMYTRRGPMKFAVNPRPNSFTGPVAILVDELSASTSEIMAGGLQDLGRARVFGQTTAGAALPSVIEKLPNGDGFQYAIADYISHGGVTLEGAGVAPDEEIILTRENLLTGIDPAIAAAREWILQNNQ